MEATWFDGSDTGCAAELEAPAAAPAPAAVAAPGVSATVFGLASAGEVAPAALGVACQYGPARPNIQHHALGMYALTRLRAQWSRLLGLGRQLGGGDRKRTYINTCQRLSQ
jgi:hypothetical protein